MSRSTHAGILGDVRRYLFGRREAGMDLIHRLEGEGGRIRRGAPRIPAVLEGGSARGSGPVFEETIPDARDRASEGQLGIEEAPGGADAGHKAVDPAGGLTSGSRHVKGFMQKGLFSEDEAEEELRLGDLDIEALEKLVSTCTRCPLSKGRTRTVFGAGSAKAKIVFIGEAPGRDEDIEGIPFVGRAGKLLTKILASVGLSRDEVYITNILKCRPPQNRDPNEVEIRACEVYLARQLELISPPLICALGRVAGQNLLKSNASLSVLRQGMHYYNDIRVIVTYHPAALLRNPNLKRDAWEDMKMIRRLYDEQLRDM